MNRRRDDHERMLDGTASADDPVARLLDAARGPATPIELDGLAAATAAFAGAQGATGGDVAARAPHRRPVLVGALAAAGLGTKMFLAAVAVGAVGVAAVELGTGGPHNPVPAGSAETATSAPTSGGGSSSTGGSATATHAAHPIHPSHPTHPSHPIHSSHPAPSERPTATGLPTHQGHPAHPSHPSHPSHPAHPTKKAHPSHPAHPTKKAHPSRPAHPTKKPHPGRPGKPAPPAPGQDGSANRLG